MWLPQFETPSNQIDRILDRCRVLRSRTDQEVQNLARELRMRARSGTPLRTLAVDGFALVREAARRTLGIEHHPVQLLGGLHMSEGHIIEMETGQGKTLTATLPLTLHAMAGRGAHLATSNDYLAQRDAEHLAPLYQRLGLSCGYVVDGMPDAQRAQSYRCDITYGTGTEFGFDFLRDRMKRTINSQGVQRGLHFILADEADALLIDDANTPLILGAQGDPDLAKEDLLQWALDHALRLSEGTHFKTHRITRRYELTPIGRSWVRSELCRSRFQFSGSMLELFDWVEKAILVQRDYHRDRQYIVRDGAIVLVQESTGRLGEGRQLQDGLHQLIEVREGIPLSAPNSHAARVTVQGFFLTYRVMAGMSGTVLSAARELGRVYRSSVHRIPTAQPSKRLALPPLGFQTAEEKWNAICDEIQQMREKGRSILVGTRSVAKSEHLSRLLSLRQIEHCVLNAKCHAEEAAIVAQAGETARVTVATGMAGRGTDIRLSPTVKEAGGLHVILSEMHDSIRSDQQLMGRCARQGDPGSYRQFMCLEDEILDVAYGPEKARKLRSSVSIQGIPKCLVAAQNHLEHRHRQTRTEQLHSEKQKLKSLREMGLDPVLETLA
jgi:preprotein translocase subunit SecA